MYKGKFKILIAPGSIFENTGVYREKKGKSYCKHKPLMNIFLASYTIFCELMEEELGIRWIKIEENE
jgi:hypothetical protein